MNTIIRVITAAVLTAGNLGLAGVAGAAPLNDPAGLCSIHNDKGDCWVAASGPSVNIDMTFPAGDPQEQAIVDYLTQVQKDFDDNTSLGTLDDPKPLQELEVTTTPYTSGSTSTLVLKTYQNLGGPHPQTFYKSFTYDRATKSPVTFDSLFRPGGEPLPVLLPIVTGDITNQVQQPITIDPALGLDPANYQNFALTDDAVIFFFDQNALMPALGATEVSVPRAAIADLLAPGI